MFDTHRGNRIKDLFSEAMELDPRERDVFLDRAVGGDSTLRVEVDELINAYSRAGEFLADPAFETMEGHGAVIGRYTLVRLIGEGGFGRVYLAEQREPVKRTVALKIIKLGMDTREVIARFEAERQALAIMDHAGIAKVFDAGATPTGRPYFVMELVDGVPITDFCNQHRLTIEQRIGLFIMVCAAVQHAHTKSLIHRDLKPTNVLVSMRDGVPLPKIIDFGIAKATSANLTDDSIITQQRGLIGTPQYMSPEQIIGDGGDIDTRSDVYSLGVVLYELLTGMTPLGAERFRTAGLDEIQRIVRDEEPPKPSTRASALDANSELAAQRSTDTRRLTARLRGDLDWITLKALEKNRERRYSSPAELADDLRRHVRHEPVLASPPSTLYQMKKFTRRHRVGVIAGSLVATAVIVGSVGTMIGLFQARESADAARDAAQQAKAINDFMAEILTSVSPEADGADVRLVEVMDDASAAASTRFANLPVLEAQIRDLLGDVYSDLTMYQKAKIEFKRAMELWQAHVGPDDPRTLMSELHYAGSAINNQDSAEVGSRLPLLAERMRRVFGPHAVATLDVERAMGIVHLLRGNIDEGERILLDVRAKLLAHGDDDDLQIRLLRNLIRAGRIKAYGDDRRFRSDIVNQIAPLAKEQVERAERVYGPGSLVALEARVIWAELLVDQRQHEAAAQTCRAVLEAASPRVGECHYLRIKAFDVLTHALHRLGDSATAADVKIKAIACLRQGGDAMAFIVHISDALPILDRGGRWIEGETVTREYIDRLQAMGGGHDDMSFAADLWVARFVSLQGRLEEAESQFQSLLTRAKEADLSRFLRARLHLFHGSNLCKRRAFEESEAELLTAADTLEDFRLGTLATNPDDVLMEFIALYNAWGKPEVAQEYQAIREQTLANLPIDSH